VSVRLELEGTHAFAPGATVAGRVRWELASPPQSLVVRLFWRTSGRGTADLTIVNETRFAAGSGRDERSFRFTLPAGPYSFSGKLISLAWAVEAVAEPSDDAALVEIVVGPGGREVVLQAVPGR
jgi:hypothetical protein